MQKVSVVFRCDASPSIGGGHVVRCLALAQELQRGGYDVQFAVSDETLETVAELAEAFPDSLTGMTVGSADLARLVDRWPNGADILVVDHYGLDETFEREAARWARCLLVLDDFPNRRHQCTLLLDTTLGRQASEYEGLVPPGTQLMCGSQYALLREPFRRHRASGALISHDKDGPLRVLVSMGMTDGPNATAAVLAGLLPLANDLSVDVALGANAPHVETVRQMVARAGSAARFHPSANAEAMAALTAAADLVIGAPGSASYERCCLAKPTLLLLTADNQTSNATALEAAGAAQVLGMFPGVSPGELEDGVRRHLADRSKLRSMALAASAIADGLGPTRVLGIIEDRKSYCESHSQHIYEPARH